MKKTYYVAASWKRREEARVIAKHVELSGGQVTGQWLQSDRKPYHEDVVMGDSAVMDYNDVTSADEMICLTGDTLTEGGRHAEVGIALTQKKRIWILGPREQVFHYHPLCVMATSVADVMAKSREVVKPYLTITPSKREEAVDMIRSAMELMLGNLGHAAIDPAQGKDLIKTTIRDMAVTDPDTFVRAATASLYALISFMSRKKS